MKKILLFIGLICLLSTSYAQYDSYFTEQQLRLDYGIIGTKNTATYAINQMLQEPYFGGNKKNLIDYLNYGDYKVEVFDVKTHKLIYSRGFNSLFGEWQTTEEAKTITKAFTESVVTPFPKNTVEIVISSRLKDGTFKTELSHIVDPTDMFIRPANHQPYEIFNVWGNTSPAKAVDIVIIPDGYTAEEMEKFKNDSKRFAEVIFSYEPWAQYKDKFNIRAILAPSQDSGVDIPEEGFYVSTIVNSSFNTFGTSRYLMTFDHYAIRDLAGMVPYDQIYILSNTKKYGGGGIFNYYSTSAAGNFSTADVIIHEFGHAFAGLADEYYDDAGGYEEFYRKDVEPWEPNITTLVDFDKKWRDMLDKNTPIPTPDTKEYSSKIGVFEGGGYEPKGVYRPKHECMMKSFVQHNFCEVCSRAIVKMILFYTE